MASRKPLLSPQHMKNRKSWCAAYLKMDPRNGTLLSFQMNADFKFMPT